MTFEHPPIAWAALIGLACLAVFLLVTQRRRRAQVRRFTGDRILEGALRGYSPGRQHTKLAFRALALAALTLALAGPRWGHDWEEAVQKSLDVLVAIDTSRSMLAADLPPNRLQRARLAALDLQGRAATDRMGLIAFAGTAFLQCPLTLDDTVFRQSLDTLSPDIIPVGGSSIKTAIEAAQEAFEKQEPGHRVLILFTDGEDHEEGAVAAAREAAKKGLRVFTVGVGTPAGELIQIRDNQGAAEYVRDNEGNVVKSRLNETLLREVATETDGFYVALRSPGAMDLLYEKGLAPLPRSEGESRLVRRPRQRFQWFLSAALLLLILDTLIPERHGIFHRRLNPLRPTVAAGLLLGFSFPDPGQAASTRQAARLFQQGDFAAAEKAYEDVLKDRPDDPRIHYNRGTAAYRAGRFETARESLARALESPEIGLQQNAYFQLGNTRFREGEAQSNPQSSLKDWQEALGHYEAALKLNPEDADAKYNRDLVKKRIEELKEQMPQSPQDGEDSKDQNEKQDDQKESDPKKQDSSEDQDQDPDSQKQKNENQQQQKNQDSQENQPSDSPPQDPQQQNQPQQPNQKPDASDPGESGRPEGQDPEAQKDQPQGAPNEQGKDGQPGEQQGEGQPVQPLGQMTQEQARQLLRSLEQDARTMMFFKPPKGGVPAQPIKNW